MVHDPREDPNEVGYPTITQWKVLNQKKEFALLEVIGAPEFFFKNQVQIFTGFQHQIRVTLAYFGHPILGKDKLASCLQLHPISYKSMPYSFQSHTRKQH